MEPPLYNGTWITCGSYAFLHAAGLDKKLLLSVENSAGVSFGMASMQEAWDYTQLLTPAFDFHAGIDAAAPLWGWRWSIMCATVLRNLSPPMGRSREITS